MDQSLEWLQKMDIIERTRRETVRLNMDLSSNKFAIAAHQARILHDLSIARKAHFEGLRLAQRLIIDPPGYPDVHSCQELGFEDVTQIAYMSFGGRSSGLGEEEGDVLRSGYVPAYLRYVRNDGDGLEVSEGSPSSGVIAATATQNSADDAMIISSGGLESGHNAPSHPKTSQQEKDVTSGETEDGLAHSGANGLPLRVRESGSSMEGVDHLWTKILRQETRRQQRQAGTSQEPASQEGPREIFISRGGREFSVRVE